MKVYGLCLENKKLIARCKLLGCFEKLVKEEIREKLGVQIYKNRIELNINYMKLYFDSSMQLTQCFVPILDDWYNDFSHVSEVLPKSIDVVNTSGLAREYRVFDKRIVVNNVLDLMVIYKGDEVYGIFRTRDAVLSVFDFYDKIVIKTSSLEYHMNPETLKVRLERW